MSTNLPSVYPRNKNCVVAERDGMCVAVARRVSSKHDWEIETVAWETYNDIPQRGVYTLVATVKSKNLPEVLQRKMVLAILKELV